MSNNLGAFQGGSVQRNAFEGMTFKVADENDLPRVFALRNAVYREALGHVPLDKFDAVAVHMLALGRDGDALATFRLVPPAQRPFDIENSVDLDQLIGPGRSPALVGRLCVRNDRRHVSSSSFLLMGLVKLAYKFAITHGVTDYFLYTYDNLRAFYRGLLFEDLNFSFVHKDWGLVYLFHLDVGEVAQRHGAAHPRSSAFARFLFESDDPKIIV